METRRDVFHAIADPTRRQIIGLLAGGSMNLNAIAGEFDMTRQAVSLHVKVLTECGLLVIKQQGRERFCEARLDRLNEVVSWAEQYRKHWNGRFLALEKHLQETATVKNKKYGRKKH
jgi:DNA-binding transcriptional ArsR family regulator